MPSRRQRSAFVFVLLTDQGNGAGRLLDQFHLIATKKTGEQAMRILGD
jgi:hypothetical protein